MSPRLITDILSGLQADAPKMVVLAGSNGAGKSTFFARYLSQSGLPFVNADNIARLLNPAAPEKESYRAMFQAERLRLRLVEQRESFCMETVLSDPRGQKLRFLESAKAAGYRLLFIWIRIDSPDLSAARVRTRVRQGGHDVPGDKLKERFPRTQANAREALRITHVALVIDNSSSDVPYQHRETWRDGHRIWPET